ncbi:MAG: putative ABC transporter permease protein y4oR [Alphaproteobacteria bacterium]|nr:MAG: putative ABC transporter permease protein y4oR [Alphaproteobacteria bacterium]
MRKFLCLVAVVVLVFVYLFPYTWMVLSAFRYPADTFAIPPKLFFEISFDGFRNVFRQSVFGLYLMNSLIITLFSVAITMLVATPAAYALVRISRGGTAFLLTVLIARMIPAIALVVPIYIIGNLTRQLDTYQIMIVVTVAFNLPFAIWMVRGFFLDLPANLVDAARIDGASEWQVLTQVAAPLARGGIFATSVFVFVGAWNEFLFALILTSGRTTTATVALLSFRTSQGIEWDTISAGAFMVSLPVIVFAFIMQRYLVEGLTMGAVK